MRLFATARPFSTSTRQSGGLSSPKASRWKDVQSVKTPPQVCPGPSRHPFGPIASIVQSMGERSPTAAGQVRTRSSEVLEVEAEGQRSESLETP